MVTNLGIPLIIVYFYSNQITPVDGSVTERVENENISIKSVSD